MSDDYLSNDPAPPPPPPGEQQPPPPGGSQPPPPTTPPLSLTGPPSPQSPGGELPEGTWGPGRAFGGLGFLIAVVFVLSLIVYGIDSELDSLVAQVALQAMLGGALILTAFLFASPDLRSLASPEALGLRRPVRPAIWLAIATYFGYVACAIVVTLLLSPEQEDITRDLGGDSGALGTIVAGLLIVFLAPISEELFFRGLLFSGFRRSLPLPVAALIASVIWGLFHYTGPGTWGVVVQITIFGLWLSWLYNRTGSIYPTMAVHAVNNAVAFTILIAS